MSAVARFAACTIDAADPVALANFYCAVTGWSVMFSSDDFVYIGGEDGRLGFQRVTDHHGPAWPGPAKQMHLDFGVDDLDRAEQQLVELGAQRPDHQPDGPKWRVLIDPAGHPFCITNAV